MVDRSVRRGVVGMVRLLDALSTTSLFPGSD